MITARLAGAVRDQPVPRYQWRARTYPHAQRAIAAAEAEHGPPEPTCLHCGGTVLYGKGNSANGCCSGCGEPPADVFTMRGQRGAAPATEPFRAGEPLGELMGVLATALMDGKR